MHKSFSKLSLFRHDTRAIMVLILLVHASVTLVLFSSHQHTKLEPYSWLCWFIGYGLTQKGYNCYDLITKCLWVSWHVEFWEQKPFTSLSSFSPSSSTHSPPIFTDHSIALFLDSYVVILSSSNSFVIATLNPIHTLVGPPTITSIPKSSLILEPLLFSQVSVPHTHLHDYHCFYVLITLHEPHNIMRLLYDPFFIASNV